MQACLRHVLHKQQLHPAATTAAHQPSRMAVRTAATTHNAPAMSRASAQLLVRPLRRQQACLDSYWPCRGVGVSTSADSCAALSVKPTFTSSCASQRRVVSSLLRQPVNCGLRSRSGRHCRKASRALCAAHCTQLREARESAHWPNNALAGGFAGCGC